MRRALRCQVGASREGSRQPAPRVNPRPVERFRARVEQALAPTLRPGDIVVMDNLGAHKVAGVRDAIQARGARFLYLPPYSPHLNPIERPLCSI